MAGGHTRPGLKALFRLWVLEGLGLRKVATGTSLPHPVEPGASEGCYLPFCLSRSLYGKHCESRVSKDQGVAMDARQSFPTCVASESVTGEQGWKLLGGAVWKRPPLRQ